MNPGVTRPLPLSIGRYQVQSLIGRGGQIEKVLDTIADELRSQYTLGFYPSRPDDGRFHQIRVRVRAGFLQVPDQASVLGKAEAALELGGGPGHALGPGGLQPAKH